MSGTHSQTRIEKFFGAGAEQAHGRACQTGEALLEGEVWCYTAQSNDHP